MTSKSLFWKKPRAVLSHRDINGRTMVYFFGVREPSLSQRKHKKMSAGQEKLFSISFGKKCNQKLRFVFFLEIIGFIKRNG